MRGADDRDLDQDSYNLANCRGAANPENEGA